MNDRNKYHINYVSQGNGPPVILIHGIAASLYDWAGLMPALVSFGYSVHALDLLGHGDSAKPEVLHKYHIESLFDHLADWVDGLRLDTPTLIIGHSLGGYLSLMYSLRRADKVRGLVLIDPLYSPKQLSPIMRLARRRPIIGEKALRLAPEWLFHTVLGWDSSTLDRFSAQTRHQVVADFKRASPKIVYITRTISDLSHILFRINPPTLVVWGEKDQTLNPDSFPLLVKALPNANSHVVPGCGHQPHRGKATIVNHLILDFLEGNHKTVN